MECTKSILMVWANLKCTVIRKLLAEVGHCSRRGKMALWIFTALGMTTNSPTHQAFYHSPVSLLSPKKSRSVQATCSLVPRSVRAMRIGFLTCHDSHDNENVKKQFVKISKTTILHVHHAFFFSFLCRHWTGKCLISRFYGGRKQAMAKFSFSFWT